MSVARYQKYKHSGVDWLGEVPAHWLMTRLKHICTVTPSNVDKKSSDGEMPVSLCNYTDVYYNESITADLDFMAATATADQIEKFSLRAGQTIITKDSETADDIAIASYVPNDLPGVVCGYHLSIIAPNPGTSGAFIKRFFDSSFAKAYFAVRANGLTRVGLSQYALDNVELSFPPLPEQISIALFLGRETAKIDALVNEQQRLIKLMKEKRQAVVSHAVTNGLDPNAPVKDSGVEWLDQVPEHWDISRVKYNCSVKGRIGFRGYTTADQVDEGDGALVLGATHITSLGEINIDEPVFLSWEKYFKSPEIAVSPSNVLVVQRGSTCGKVGFVSADNGPATINPSLVLLKDFACSPRFLFHYLSSAVVQGFFNGILGSTAIPMLSQEQIGNIVFCVPPRNEQDDIVAFIDSETAKLDILAAEAQRAIDLLLERRNAIISDAVTGKIDVRGLAEADAPDPDAVAA